MKPTILAIDDDEPMLWLISKILKDFEVVCKTDGLDAMIWLSKGNFPDLIILDRQMPNLGGKQLLKGLRGSGMYKDTPVFFVSSWQDIELDDELKNLNVKEFISKPFDPESLLQKVEDHLYEQTLTH
jgi:two-component system, chemotaxis family, chemotaxis protein CheY